ncbi:MAG: CotH kinase family protein [Saprospiraceae bacterium]|nr:CotH kinase family protein [Saprospiraceae bacterium]
MENRGFSAMHRVLILSVLIVVVSCSESEPGGNDPGDPQPNPNEVSVVIPTGNENYLNLKSDYIYDQSKLHTFELNLPAGNLEKLDNDPTAEKYVEGSLTFEGETLSPIGIRYKGSIGAYVGCVSGSDWSNPSGRKTCTKLSMKVKVNWNDSDDKFYGLKKLQFHSQNLDDSQMRDRLGYHLFREMDVPAPRSVHAKLLVNGVFVGVFAMVEQIDGRFTRQNFDNGKGNLYKEIWPLHSSGSPFRSADYLASLETNEDEDPTSEMIESFARAIQSASEDSLKAVVGRWMNVDEIIAYAVVDRTIRADDGPFHWYCDGGISSADCSPHNFYWYEEPTERTMHLIPWDLDNAFENIILDNNPVTPIADSWGETSSNCEPFSYGRFNLMQKSAACDKLIYAWTLFEDEYLAIKEDFKNGPFAEEEVSPLLDLWAAQIREATQEAASTHEDAVSIVKWETALNNMKASLSIARTK